THTSITTRKRALPFISVVVLFLVATQPNMSIGHCFLSRIQCGNSRMSNMGQLLAFFTTNYAVSVAIEAGAFTMFGTHERNRAADRFVTDGAVCTIMEAATKRCRSLLMCRNETPRRATTCWIGNAKSARPIVAAYRPKFLSIRNRSRSVSV